MRRGTLLLLSLLGALFALTACSEDSNPTGPGGGGGTPLQITIAAERLDVQADCDAFSGEFAAGDFFIRVELVGSPGGTATVLGQTDYELFQLNDGESANLGLAASGIASVTDGYQVRATVSIYENDGDGPQVTQTDEMLFEYSASTGCWTYAGDDSCLGRSGSITIGATRLRGQSGDPCSADLYWRFLAESTE